MLLIAVLSLSLIGHPPRLPARVGPWRIEGRLDRFAETRVCAISAAGVGLHRNTLVFRVEPRGDTRQALFRIDAGPPRPVAEVFDAAETDGFFPQRGWIINPDGGEVVLPAAFASAARTITIRTRIGRPPRRFNVARLNDALAVARSEGCATVVP